VRLSRTIARVLSASDVELTHGIQQVISDEPVSDASEEEAWGLLGDVITAELADCSGGALRTEQERGGVVPQDVALQRAELLVSLAEARELVLHGARRAINSRHAAAAAQV
jgi:hypothetical protein